jgi:hypothetical protein
LYTTFENKLCNTETINESPFSVFIGKSQILLSEIEKCTIYMDHVFIRFYLYYKVESHMTVYRGLNIPKGSELSLYITGITSVYNNLLSQFTKMMIMENLYYQNQNQIVILLNWNCQLIL